MKRISVALIAFLVVSVFTLGFRTTQGFTIGVTWMKYPGNPVIRGLVEPSVIHDGHMFKMWCSNLTGFQICYAFSPNGIDWTVHGVVLDRGEAGSWDHNIVREPVVLFDGRIYRMWYLGQTDYGPHMVGYATSLDGISWTKSEANPVLVPGGNGGWDDWTINNLAVIFNGTHYIMWYGGSQSFAGTGRVGVATSVDGISWTKYSHNPVLVPGTSEWENGHVFPGAVFADGSMYLMWYWGFEYPAQKTLVGLATSIDGFSWSKYEGNPVLGPGPPGSWDSLDALSYSVLEKGNSLMMWYGGRSSGPGDGEGIGLATSHAPCILAGVDFDPDTLNLRSSGKWITAYIELPEGHNVADIDASTVLLNETVAVDFSAPTTVGDYDGDGVPDLMVRFDRAAVSDLILSQDITSGNVVLTIRGRLCDGTIFEGSDTIRVMLPMPKSHRSVPI
ncbi:hypothetical protein MUP01_02335 [Candidatus Bathyarchaeota archaeon]|nr:hypothetical protein [Candidatus Bathyarchaeota archaeon]